MQGLLHYFFDSIHHNKYPVGDITLRRREEADRMMEGQPRMRRQSNGGGTEGEEGQTCCKGKKGKEKKKIQRWTVFFFARSPL